MDDWRYEFAEDLEQPLLERLRRFPREPDMLSWGLRAAAAVVFRAWMHTYHRLRIEGIENLPAGQSFVMVANHASHLDALCLLSAVPMRQLHQAFPAAAADYFFVTLPRIAMAVLLVNALPFDRQAHGRQSLTICRQLLDKPGNILILFPEGTRTTNGGIGEFKPGIGILAAGTDVPVVPCYLSGTRAALPKGSAFPRPKSIRLTIGKPRWYPNHALERDSIREICDDLRQAVIDLSPAKENRNITEPVVAPAAIPGAPVN